MDMKLSMALLAAIALLGCSPAEKPRFENIMDAIEQGIQMPPNAEPLNAYARTYKFDSSRRVVAFYFIPHEELDIGSCAETKKYGPTNGQILLSCPPPDGMTAGERRWLDDKTWLPVVDDGGCRFVNVEYDLEAKAIISVRCNGHP